MLTDAHCHPFDLTEHFPAAEDDRRRRGVMCAASASSGEEFTFCEQLSHAAKNDTASPLLPCFAVHPQMMAHNKEKLTIKLTINDQLTMLEALAAEGRLAAVGETGFDLFNGAYRETEKIQDDLFAVHLETALRYGLPLVIHVRRAMHKIFAAQALLKKCRAVIFHSWPGTAGEGDALLRRGINAFFSFGACVMLNHREAMRCCAVFPAGRLLTETDAPFQPPRNSAFSTYADLDRILETASALRREAGNENLSTKEMETIVAHNFLAAFGVS